VHVPDFAVADSKFHAAKAVWRLRDFFPGRNRFVDLLSCATHWHNFTPSLEIGSVLHRVIRCAVELIRFVRMMERVTFVEYDH
jgi:hypothetical protein